MLTLEHAKLMPGLVVIRPKDEQASQTIIMPERVDLRQGFGQVVNTGPDTDVHEGEWVIFERGRGTHFGELDNNSNDCLVLLKAQHILAAVE
jgi:co-chaperonin GroES (HSP10)